MTNSFISQTGNATIQLQKLAALSGSNLVRLSALMGACDYEPYYTEEPDSSIWMFGAFHENVLTGFLSFLFNREDETAELTALVEPAFQGQGLFTALLTFAKEALAASEKHCNYTIIGSIPSALCLSSREGKHFPYGTADRIAFTEHMMKLTFEHFQNCEDFRREQNNIDSVHVPDDASTAHDLNTVLDFGDYEFCFSDDGTEYYMYEDEDADEPCALLCLAPEKTFTNVYGVWVDKELRGKGIGTMLMSTFLEDYFEDDTRPLVLNVRSTNAAAVSLYKKCGFTEVSHISYYIF